MRKLSKKELKSIAGGISCYCGGAYMGEFANEFACFSKCTGVRINTEGPNYQGTPINQVIYNGKP